MLKIKKPLIAAVSLALGLGMASSAQAAAELFATHDAADGTLAIGGFDWSPTTFLAQNAVTAIGTFAFFDSRGLPCPTGACTFNVLTQANLGGFLDIDGGTIGGTGLNARYQVTMIAKFQETVTAASFASTTSSFVITPGTPVAVEFYYDKIGPTAGPTCAIAGACTKANQLTGNGFNDGTLILKAESIIDPATGAFTITSSTTQTLDQSPNGNQYQPTGGNQLTVPGRGDTEVINLGKITQDNTFFLNAITHLDFSNIGQSLPFKTVDPMDCFTDTVLGSFKNTAVTSTNGFYACNNLHTNGTYLANAGTQADVFGYVPSVGAINAGVTGGPDTVAQTDFNSTLTGVPEPTSLALMGLGLGVLGFGAGRRRHPKAA